MDTETHDNINRLEQEFQRRVCGVLVQRKTALGPRRSTPAPPLLPSDCGCEPESPRYPAEVSPHAEDQGDVWQQEANGATTRRLG